MSANYPPFAMFPDLNVILRTPSGLEYRGSFRQHPSTKQEGEHWYEGYLAATHKDAVLADTNLVHAFKRDGSRPGYFDAKSTAEPLRLKLNRVPQEHRNERNAEMLVGEVWTHEGLWTVMARTSKSPSLHLNGNVVPSRHEITFEGSRIRQYQLAQDEVEPAEAPARPPRRRAGGPQPS